MRPTMTHTYVTFDIPAEWYDSIKARLIDAGYGHTMNQAGDIDMSGIALTRGEPVEVAPKFVGLLMRDRPDNIEVVGPFSTFQEASGKLSGVRGSWVCISPIVAPPKITFPKSWITTTEGLTPGVKNITEEKI